MSNRNRRKNKIRDNKQKARRNAPPVQGWLGKTLDVIFFEFYVVGNALRGRGSACLQTSQLIFLIGLFYFMLLLNKESGHLNLGVKILIGVQLLLQLIWWLRYGNIQQIELLKIRRKDRHPVMFLLIWTPIFGYPLWRLYEWY